LREYRELRWYYVDALRAMDEASKPTTPDAPDTQRQLQVMRDREGVIRDRGYATQDEMREGR